MNDMDNALKDFLYEFSKNIGIIWLIKKIPFLKLKQWVKERDK